MAKLCASKEVDLKMRAGVELAKTVKFNCDSYVYLNKIDSKFKSELRKNSKFLELLECSKISGLFEAFFKEIGHYKTKNIELHDINGGDILIIKCPSIFASYHFIVVAVNQEKTRVSIIQSYGKFKKFHKIQMSFEEFMVLLTTLESFKTEEKSFDEAYPEMIRVEAKLYGVDDKKYIKHLEKHRVMAKNSQGKGNEVFESEEEEDGSYKERAKALNIPSDIYENLEYQYSINQITLEIKAYRVKSALKESVKVGKKKSKCKRKIKKNRTKKKQLTK